MKMRKTIAALAAVATLSAIAVPAQDLFVVKFNATGTPGNDGKGTVKITQKNLIEQCVGTGFSDKEIKNNFALVYNSATDTIQVVNQADGSVVCDVFQFQGGTVTTANSGNNNNDKLVRLTFVFIPDQADAVGSATITEKPAKNLNSDKAKAAIQGKIQFTTAKPFVTVNPQHNNNDTNNTSGSDTNNVGDTNAAPTTTSVDTTTASTDTTQLGNLQRFVQAGALGTTSTVGGQVFNGTFSAGKLFVAGVNKNNNKNSNNNNDNNNNDNNNNNNGDQSGSGNGSGSGGGATTNIVVSTGGTVTTNVVIRVP